MKSVITNETGLGRDTKIVDADTGQTGEGIVSVEDRAVTEPLRATLRIHAVRLHLSSSDVQWKTGCPHCGQDLLLYPGSGVGVDEGTP